MSDSLSVRRLETRADRTRFLAIPGEIHSSDPNWICPMLFEEARKLEPKKHPFFEHGEAEFWIASRGGKPVGRIAALVNHSHLDKHQDGGGHFGMFEAEDDQQVFDALIDTAAEWLKRKGLTRMAGPASLSVNEEYGLLVGGFDTPPMIMMGHSPPYYSSRFEQAGLEKAKDLLAYLLDLTKPLPEPLTKLARRARERIGVKVRSIDKRNATSDLRLAVEVFNDAWSANWGFVSLSDSEAAHFVKSLKAIIIRDLFLYAERHGETSAIMAAIPNLNEAIHDLDGRLLPFGWIKLIWRLKVRRISTARVFLMGVRRSIQKTSYGAGIVPVMIEDIYNAGCRKGMKYAELSWVLEDNRSMNRFIQMTGASQYKTYRIYQKML